MFNFFKSARQFSKVVVQIYIPTSDVCVSPYLHQYLVSLFCFSHPSRYVVVSHLGFN